MAILTITFYNDIYGGMTTNVRFVWFLVITFEFK